MIQASRLPAVPAPKLPDAVHVSVNAQARRNGFFGNIVDVEVENESPSPLLCDIRGRTRSGEIAMRPGYVWIDPNTTGTLHVRVGLRVPGINAVVVRLRDCSREYLAEAPVPAPLAVRALAVLAVCALLGLGAILAAGWARPRIAAYAPSRVFVGDDVDVGYSAGGIGNVSYVVRRDGSLAAHGKLPPGTGTLRFATDGFPAHYTIAVSISGPLGSASSEQTVNAQATPRPPVEASIISLDAHPPVAVSGSVVKVRYAAVAQSGTLRILDAKGTPWDAAAINRRGWTSLHAPHVDAPRHFTVRLEVRYGSSIAAASIGLEVLPKPSSRASPRGAFATPPPAAVSDVSTSPRRIVSGTFFAVRLLGAAARVAGRATLQSSSGTPLEANDIAPERPARFLAPAVKRPTTFYVMVSATHDRSGQLIVVPVTIHPK